MKLTLFERMIFVVIMEVMHVAGIPAKYKEKLSSHLYRMAMSGEIKESDIMEYE
jgi:hypothetical protein